MSDPAEVVGAEDMSHPVVPNGGDIIVTPTCWFNFGDGHCMLPGGHDEPHEKTPDSDIIISLHGEPQ